MKKKIILFIIFIIVIISIILFCCVNKPANNNTGNTIKTSNQISNDDFIDVSLARQYHEYLNLSSDFTFAGFQKYREGGAYKYYYYFNKDTTAEITVNNNKVTTLGVSIICNGSSFNRTEYLDCIDKLLAKNWFNFSKKEKENIRSSILDGDMSEKINDIYIHTFTDSSLFWTIFI